VKSSRQPGTIQVVPDLESLGWDAAWEALFAAHAAENVVPARVAVQHRGAYDVLSEAGETRAHVPRKLVRASSSPADLPCVGDWVVLSPADATIRAVLPRRTRFSRLAAHDPASETTVEQVVAANVDVVFVLTSLNDELNVRRLERYLTLAWQSGARPVVVLTKADLVESASHAVAQVAGVAGDAPILVISTRTGIGLDDILSHVAPGETAALLGSSGVGKSTLANALLGEELLATAEIRSDGKGRHKTIRRQLVLLPDGALLIDTPGLRELQLWEAPEGLADAFPDVVELTMACRFADCAHRSEPGCAVQAALADGSLDSARYSSYRKLEAELEELDRRLATREHRRRAGTRRR
jgi:ribosome biogenesis GTPase